MLWMFICTMQKKPHPVLFTDAAGILRRAYVICEMSHFPYVRVFSATSYRVSPTMQLWGWEGI